MFLHIGIYDTSVLFWIIFLICYSLPENLQQIVTNQFSRVVENERCSFLGNVSLGSSISLPELRDMYDVVRLTCWIILLFFTNSFPSITAYLMPKRNLMCR